MTPRLTALALYARLTEGFDQRLEKSTQTLREAALDHSGRIVQASSLGAEDVVISDLIARNHLAITIATIETGMLHPETLALIARLEAHCDLVVETHRPAASAVVHLLQKHGPRLMYESVELRKQCCAVRKLAPLELMLTGRSAWVTGLRREQSNQRSEVAMSELDDRGRFKLNPLAEWSWADVWHYISTHKVPYNPLHDAFYPSVGCAPCTRAVAAGEDSRAGRWWWEDDPAKECGLHVASHLHDAVAAATSSGSSQ